MAEAPRLDRWTLVLGRFAEERLGRAGGNQGRMAQALDFVYGREYEGRGVRGRSQAPTGAGGSNDASVLTVPEWIREVRDLFPSDVCEVVTRHALERYEMTALVTDPEVLQSIEPSYDLLKAVLTFKGAMQGEVVEVARGVVRRVVDDLRRQLEKEVRTAITGLPDRSRRTRRRRAHDLHLRRTLARSLKHYDPKTRRLTAADLQFFTRSRQHATWDIVIAVDCSGSMLDSVIHAAVMAAIFAGLPMLRVRLVAFDTQVVDLSEHMHDIVEVLFSVQLGGGTDIAQAARYCAKLVDQPTRTIFVLVTDFEEGGSSGPLVEEIRRMRGAGVRVFGLAALGSDTAPRYDRSVAEACAAAGADVAALTPGRLAQWVAEAIR
jgi:Mg-chelatase subunit ChlD